MAEPTHIYLSGVLYDLDVRNGLNACDGFYTPYDICIDINAGEDKFFYLYVVRKMYPAMVLIFLNQWMQEKRIM